MSSIKQINGYIPTLCLKMTIVILLKSPLCHHPSEMLWFLCSNLKKGTFDCIFFLHNETHTFAWTTDFFFYCNFFLHSETHTFAWTTNFVCNLVFYSINCYVLVRTCFIMT
jgi:hypothetical protein